MGCLAMVGCALLLAGQPPGAALGGVVRDAASGEPVAGAAVSLPDLERSVLSDTAGRYGFAQVPAGPQHLAVRRPGYAPVTLHALVPRTGRLEINLALRPEPLPVTPIAVRPPLALRGLGAGADSAVPQRLAVSAAAVRNHPLLAEPDFLAALAGGAVGVQPESPGGLHVRGGAADQIAYLLDGIPVLSPYHAAGLFSAWNPDALARLELTPVTPVAAALDALGGAVRAQTRSPGAALRLQGALSTSQARLSLDGPLPRGGGFLLSGRAGDPASLGPPDEVSYLRGGSADWLAKLEQPLARGQLRLLAYANHNRLAAAATVPAEDGDDVPAAVAANRFGWESRSWGAGWERRLGASLRLELRAWHAAGDASARWRADTAATRLVATRRDAGAALAVERSDPRHPGRRTLLGVRAAHGRTTYRAAPATGGAAGWAPRSTAASGALFAEHLRPLGGGASAEVGVVGAAHGSRLRLGSRVQLRWSPAAALVLGAGYARTHQAAQSLRNPESVIGNVFPPHLYLGSGAAGVPIARADQAALSAELRPVAGVRLAAEAYARRLAGLALVAPVSAQPFATDGVVVGRGSVRGLAIDVAAGSARAGLVSSYGYQRVRLAYGDTSYVPAAAAAHTLDAGVIAFPSTTTSLRLGVSARFGRRGTAVAGPLEWEACNVLDRGCELAGSPATRAEPLGATALPAYLRLDAGARTHWHLRLGRREGQMGVYATVVNLLGRRNVLTFADDARSGERRAVEMQSRVPLVVGVDWRF